MDFNSTIGFGSGGGESDSTTVEDGAAVDVIVFTFLTRIFWGGGLSFPF